MAETNRTAIPAISLEPLSVAEILEAVRRAERECAEALQAHQEIGSFVAECHFHPCGLFTGTVSH
jgi:hypothetical protein